MFSYIFSEFDGLFGYEFNLIPRGLKYNLFHAGRGIYAPPTTFRQFSPEVLIRGGSNYTLNLSFAIT